MQRTTYGDWAARTRRLGRRARHAGHHNTRTRRHLRMEHGTPPRALLRAALQRAASPHTLNLRLFPEQLTYIVNHAEDEVIFVDRVGGGAVVAADPHVRNGQTHRGYGRRRRRGIPTPPSARQSTTTRILARRHRRSDFTAPVDENQAASMMYTSGTTGNPKGVIYSHRSIVLHTMATMFADSLGVGESDVILPVVPMFHANAWGLAHAGVATGATCDARPRSVAEGDRRPDRERAGHAGRGRTHDLDGSPTRARGRDVSSLRAIPCGGSAVPKALSEGFRRPRSGCRYCKRGV